MKNTLVTLITSKRFLIALATIITNIALVFGVALDADKLEALLLAVNSIAATLIGGISLSDYGKAITLPAGVDHKGRADAEHITAITPEQFAEMIIGTAERIAHEDGGTDEIEEEVPPGAN